MAYRKRNPYRRTRKRKTLSNYNIATKTSAKAQSRQIYSLKKRMNWAIKRITPEIQIQQRNLNAAVVPTSSVFWTLGWQSTTGGTFDYYIAPTFNNSASTTSGTSTADRFKRLRSIRLFGNWQYTGDLTTTPTPITMRMIIVQTRTTRSNNITTDDIFTSGASASNYMNAVYGPLQNGLARTCRVLSDKRYQLNFQRPNIVINTLLRYHLGNVYRDLNSDSSGSTTSESIPKGAIYVFLAFYGQTDSFTSSTLDLGYKLAFTD